MQALLSILWLVGCLSTLTDAQWLVCPNMQVVKSGSCNQPTQPCGKGSGVFNAGKVSLHSALPGSQMMLADVCNTSNMCVLEPVPTACVYSSTYRHSARVCHF